MLASPLLLIVVVLAASVVTVALCRRLSLPSLLGYLIVGLLLGPHAFALIPDLKQVKEIAEYGVVFLMFSIGLEFSLPQFRAMRRLVLGFGSLQFVTILAALVGISLLLTQNVAASIFLGAALTMSSTAIGIKLLAERNEMSAPHSRHTIGALLFQDIAVVPLLILLPAFGASGGLSAMEIGWALIKVALLLGLLLGFGQPILRRWLHLVAQRKNNELFMLNVLLVTLALAWICHIAGLPHALGAFVAGMLIAETEYKLQVEDDIRPFRDILLGMFFISVGMQLDAVFIVSQFGWVAFAVITIVVAKTAFTYLLARRYDLNRSGASLATALLVPAGEFGFVLLTLGLTLGALSSYYAQIAIAAMVVLMLAAPFMPRFAEYVNKRFAANDFFARSADIFKIAAQSMARENHVVVCGYGRSGQYLARLLEAEHVNFVALDNDPERVREALGGENQGNVVFGDCTRREALVAAGIERARAMVVSFTDIDAAMRIVTLGKSIRHDLPIIVRTFDDEHIDRLTAAGATEVVPEVLEGSLMLATHSLLVLGTPLATVLKRIRSVREERYSLFQGFFRGASDGNENEEDARVLHTVTLPEKSWACGKAIPEVIRKLADRYEAEVTAVRRDGARIDLANEAFVFGAGDALIVLGTQRAVAAAELKLTS
jgi:monovalent cation:H+ antiporter-2, CPA2 family